MTFFNTSWPQATTSLNQTTTSQPVVTGTLNNFYANKVAPVVAGATPGGIADMWTNITKTMPEPYGGYTASQPTSPYSFPSNLAPSGDVLYGGYGGTDTTIERILQAQQMGSGSGIPTKTMPEPIPQQTSGGFIPVSWQDYQTMTAPTGTGNPFTKNRPQTPTYTGERAPGMDYQFYQMLNPKTWQIEQGWMPYDPTKGPQALAQSMVDAFGGSISTQGQNQVPVWNPTGGQYLGFSGQGYGYDRDTGQLITHQYPGSTGKVTGPVQWGDIESPNSPYGGNFDPETNAFLDPASAPGQIQGSWGGVGLGGAYGPGGAWNPIPEERGGLGGWLASNGWMLPLAAGATALGGAALGAWGGETAAGAASTAAPAMSGIPEWMIAPTAAQAVGYSAPAATYGTLGEIGAATLGGAGAAAGAGAAGQAAGEMINKGVTQGIDSSAGWLGAGVKTATDVFGGAQNLAKNYVDPIWGLIAGGAMGLGGAYMGGEAMVDAAREAGQASRDVTRMGIESQEKMFQQALELGAPWRQAGEAGLTSLQRELYGADYTPTPGEPPPQVAMGESPLYKYMEERGKKGIERSLSAQGLVESGKGIRDFTDFYTQMQAQDYQNKMNLMSLLGGYGSTASGQGAQAATSTGYGMGNMYARSASDIANSLIAAGQGRADMWTNMANVGMGGLNAYYDFLGGRSPYYA